MRRKPKSITIFRYKTSKRKKNGRQFHLPFSLSAAYLYPFFLLLFFSFVGFVIIHPPVHKSTSRTLSSQIVNLSPVPPRIASLALLSLHPIPSLTLSPTPLPKPTVTPSQRALVEKASADSGSEKGYCLHVPILLYHHVQPLDIAEQQGHAPLTVDSNYFDEQMGYLAKSGYHTISADELVDALLHHTALPEKSVMVTLDDGYDDNYDYAYQTFKKYQVVGNYMIPTGLLGAKGYMTWSQLQEMAANPLIHIYNHTWSHADLGNSSRETVESEIRRAQEQLETQLGQKHPIFTYPYGSFNSVVIDVLKEQGFVAAFSTIGGTEQCESQIMELRRLHIGNAPMSAYGF
jgi:peptidoglycan/xylan/chitin deacetylase (PgdA/CDA1 family)